MWGHVAAQPLIIYSASWIVRVLRRIQKPVAESFFFYMFPLKLAASLYVSADAAPPPPVLAPAPPGEYMRAGVCAVGHRDVILRRLVKNSMAP
jgi:hypothetical protein